MLQLETYIALILSASGLMPASGRSQESQRLATATRLTCNFATYATGSWKDGTPRAEVQSTMLTVRFEGIEATDGTARIVGDFGPSDIVVRLTQDTLHLIQIFNSGALYITTVFPKQMVDRHFQAVHSRHEYTEISLPGFTSRPEQYYGNCEVP
jgi:hypothetical protein